MVKIRLKRLGYKKNPVYRIVVLNSTTKREAAPIQQLGYYNPKTKEMKLDKTAALDWVKKGAQPTDTVKYLIDNCDAEGKLVYKQKSTQKLSKKAQAKIEAEKESKKAAAAAAAAAPPVVEEAPAAEAPAEEPKVEDAPVAEAPAEEAVAAEVEVPAEEPKVEETPVAEAKEEEPAAKE